MQEEEEAGEAEGQPCSWAQRGSPSLLGDGYSERCPAGQRAVHALRPQN